jgi:cytochrome P450
MEIFAPLSQEMLADPYAVYKQLRKEDPVHWHEELNAWIVTRYKDCARVLADPATFVNDYRKIGEEADEDILGLQTLDPPEHTRVRHALLEAMRLVDIPSWVIDCCQIADKLMSQADLSSFDFVSQFNEPLALTSMCLFFGIPDIGDEAEFYRRGKYLLRSMDFGFDHSRIQPGVEARRYMTSLIEPWTSGAATTGLLGRLDILAAGEPNRNFLLNALRQMFVAGFMSSSSTLSCFTRTLLEHRLLDQDEPFEVTPMVYNELGRHSGAVQMDTRAAIEDVVLSGTRIKKGTEVLLSPASADRDESVFAAPEDLILDRSPNPHIAFGRGVHACIGAHLALALHVAVLTRLSASYRLTMAEPPVQRPTGTLRGLDRMVLTAQPR